VPTNQLNIATTTNNYSQAFYEVFILTIVIAWLPFKLLAYATPFIGIVWFIIRSRSGKSLLLLVLALLVYAFFIGGYALFYHFKKEEYIIQNSFLSLITYGSFFFFLVLPGNALLAQIEYKKYIKVIEWVILGEALLGIFQAAIYVVLYGGNFDSATGDVVQGSLSPLSFLAPSGNFNNQIYAANMLVLLAFYVPYVIANKKGVWIVGLGFLAIIFASVMHLFIAFIVAAAIVALYFSRSFIKLNLNRIVIILFVIASIVIAIALQPRNFGLIGHYLHNVTTDQSPKTVATIKTLTKLPDDCPWVYFIGLGPGQYASRAGLIGTGNYFGEFKHPKDIPFLEPKRSFALQKYIYKSWEEVSTNVDKYGNSTMSRPFYSLLSILVEFGYVAFALILVFLIIFVKRLKKTYVYELLNKNNLNAFYSLACAVLVVFFISISIFENYMEVTQAIFPGLLLLKYFHSFTKAN